VDNRLTGGGLLSSPLAGNASAARRALYARRAAPRRAAPRRVALLPCTPRLSLAASVNAKGSRVNDEVPATRLWK